MFKFYIVVKDINRMISFTASYINKVGIKEKCPHSSRFQDKSASLVELSMLDKRDVKTLEELSYDWGDYSYATNLYEFAKYINSKQITNSPQKLLAITTQKENFKNLEPSKVLGLVEYTPIEDNSAKINLIETNPVHTYYSNDREYKNIGKGLIQGVIEHSKADKITLHSVPSAKYFYKKLGFVQNPEKKDWYGNLDKSEFMLII